MIFISHKNDPDHNVAKRIFDILIGERINCWIAPESIGEGEDFSLAIPEAINTCEIFIIILTEHTQKSDHVRKELMLAISHKKKIIPLKLGDFTLTDSFEYLLADIQVEQFSFSEEKINNLIEKCRLGERVVETEISKNPKRAMTIVKGDFQENMSYMMNERTKELEKTVFVMGIDCSSRLEISSTKGIVKHVCDFLYAEYGISLEELQRLVDIAKQEQLGHETSREEFDYKDTVLIEVPVTIAADPDAQHFLKLMFVANSRKNNMYQITKDVDDVEGIDSREIILSVFKRCQELGEQADNLFIGAMGTNGLSFPYEVITSEIINCFVYAQRCNIRPLNLFYSVRQEDMQRAGISTDDIMAYITMVVRFFRD